MDIVGIVFFLAILLLSVILHEVAHGYIALAQGDPTARQAGRLTLNPIPHIDPVGSIAVPLVLVLFQSPILFGWAKPVPVNPYNLRDKKYGSAKVSFAGPATNLAIAVFFGLLLRFLSSPIAEILPGLIPLFVGIVQVNLFLAIFNLVPIPPLDGSHILFDFLPRSLDVVRQFLTQYGFFVLLFFIFFLFRFVAMPLDWLFRLIVGF
ncbi:MAG: site-2 protease family protein [Patescibacteria group bacterium]